MAYILCAVLTVLPKLVRWCLIYCILIMVQIRSLNCAAVQIVIMKTKIAMRILKTDVIFVTTMGTCMRQRVMDLLLLVLSVFCTGWIQMVAIEW